MKLQVQSLPLLSGLTIRRCCEQKYLNDNKDVLMPGWHVPTTAEWDNLSAAVGGSRVAGTKLKSSNGWSSGNGTDDFGFTVFPAGYRESSNFGGLGNISCFWTSVNSSSTLAYLRRFSTGAGMGSENFDKIFAYSVRLVKDSV